MVSAVCVGGLKGVQRSHSSSLPAPRAATEHSAASAGTISSISSRPAARVCVPLACRSVCLRPHPHFMPSASMALDAAAHFEPFIASPTALPLSLSAFFFLHFLHQSSHRIASSLLPPLCLVLCISRFANLRLSALILHGELQALVSLSLIIKPSSATVLLLLSISVTLCPAVVTQASA